MSHTKEPWAYGIVREGEQVGVERSLAVAKQWVEADYVPLVPMKQRDDLLAACDGLLKAHRITISRPPETVMQAEKQLDAIREAVAVAEAAIASVKEKK